MAWYTPNATMGNKVYFSSDINASAGAQTQIFGAQGAGTQIWIVGYSVGANALGTYKFQSSDTDLSGVKPVGATGGGNRESADRDNPLFKCATNKAFNITTVDCTIDGEINGYVVTV